MNLSPIELAYALMTRSGRVDYEDLKKRDPKFIARHEAELNPHTGTAGVPPA
jgi:hypothetical protein